MQIFIVLYDILDSAQFPAVATGYLWPLLLTWIKLDPSMDK